MNDAATCDNELLRKLDSAASPEVSGMLNRYFVAALCESAAARLRFKDAAIDHLSAEVERLQAELREHFDLAKSSNAEHADIEAAWRAEVERLREALQSICQRYCYAYQNLAWTEMGSEYYSAYCIAAQALQLTQPLPAPPEEEE